MTQQPFSHSFQSEYISAQHLNLLPFELFNHVQAGRLHPVDKDTGQPILRPDVQRIKDRHNKIIDEIKAMSLKGGKIDTLYRGQEKEEEKRKLDSLAKELQNEHDAIVKELETIIDINDWTTYDPPEEPKNLITRLPIDLMKAFDILHNALFKKSEVEQLTTTDGQQSPAQECAPETQVETVAEEPDKDEQAGPVVPKENDPDLNAEEIIKKFYVIRVSDTEIIVKYDGKEIQASADGMGFKSNAKPWIMFMEILQDRNNQYFIGLYDKKKNPNNIKDYNNKVHLLCDFSKKFVNFVDDKFPVSLPSNFNVFKNMKGADRAGIYKPKFQVDEYQKTNKQVDIKNLSKEATLERLAALKKQCVDGKSTDEKYRLSIEIAQYCDHAIKKYGIPEGELRSFFPLPDDTPSENDMMELISEVTEKDKDRLF